METKYYTAEEWAELPEADRHEVEKRQLFMHLDEAGLNAANVLLERVNNGMIYGGLYWEGDRGCGCVLGTLKFAQTNDEDSAGRTNTRYWDSSQFLTSFANSDDERFSVVEVLAYNLDVGDTPQNSENARLLRDWTQEWIDAQQVTA